MVEDAGGGGGGGGGTLEPDYDSIPGAAIDVDITDLVTYYLKTNELAGAGIGPTLTELGEMTLPIQDGLTMPPGDGISPLPEGVHAARLIQGRISDFQHFIRDVTEGLANIGAAATVVAEMYENGDGEGAASMADIGFAFADPGAHRPDGFRGDDPLLSMDERRRLDAEAAGTTSMAAMGDDSQATSVIYPANGVTIYFFPDGSSKQVTTTQTTSQSQYQSGSNITTTTVMGPGGVVVSTKTEEKYSVYGGSQVNKVTTSSGDSQNGSSSTTSTMENPDGSIQVNSETTTTRDGESTTHASDPVTVDPHDDLPGEGAQDGTVENAQNVLGTEGDQDTKQEYGLGY